MNDNGEMETLIGGFLDLCRSRRVRVATAESCTGGLISAYLTSIAGSSDVVDRGFVTYSNEAKSDMLGVPSGLIERYGAVSGEVAAAMAEGALARSDADISISVTGIAGPSGSTDLKPVGLVWFGCAATWAPTFVHSTIFPDRGRGFVREQSVRAALDILMETVKLAPDQKSES